MITKKVEVSIMLEASTVDKLRRAARADGLSEEAIIERAIARYFGETASSARSGWLSPSTSGDWEHLVEDWLVGQVHDASD